MLKEERELRDYLRGRVLKDRKKDPYTLKDPMKLITALIRAVRGRRGDDKRRLKSVR